MPAIIILPENSQRTVKEVREEYMLACENKTRFAPDPPVPWVKIGNIYLSLFETGENSWPPIVEEITGKNYNSTAKYVIMSGRHGAPIHNQSSTFQFTGIKDESHIGEDQSRISMVNKKYTKISMEVLDVTKKEYNSPLLLKTEIKKQVNAGKTVILAWCFSIFALKTATGDMTQSGTPANLAYYVNYGKKIVDIIQEDWASMPR